MTFALTDNIALMLLCEHRIITNAHTSYLTKLLKSYWEFIKCLTKSRARIMSSELQYTSKSDRVKFFLSLVEKLIPDCTNPDLDMFLLYRFPTGRCLLREGL